MADTTEGTEAADRLESALTGRIDPGTLDEIAGLARQVPRAEIARLVHTSTPLQSAMLFRVLTKEEAPKLMHTDAVHFVKASAQAQMAKYLLDSLNETETAVLKRGRNQKSLSVPKNALLLDYKWATGFEALLGYLYVTGQSERLYELMHRATEWFTEKENVQ